MLDVRGSGGLDGGTGADAAMEADVVAELDETGLTRWGEEIGRQAVTPLVLTLRGDLGTGKTTLARAIARGAGVGGHVPSPTYNLLFRYPSTGGRTIVHLDLYRIEDEEEIWELGWSELPGEDEVVIVEWPERAETMLPEPRWEIELSESGDPNTRNVRVRPVGDPGHIPLPGGRRREG